MIGAYLDDERPRRRPALSIAREFEKRGIGVTATQVGWGQPVQRVRERRRARAPSSATGAAGASSSATRGDSDNVFVRSEGERLVIYDGSRDLVVKP